MEYIELAKTENGDYRGFTVEIYKAKGRDCSNGGVSSKFDEVFFICPNGHQLASESKLPIFKMVTKNNYNSAVQVNLNGEQIGGWAMMGGCFIYCCDSRFRRVSEYPLPLHDRYER